MSTTVELEDLVKDALAALSDEPGEAAVRYHSHGEREQPGQPLQQCRQPKAGQQKERVDRPEVGVVEQALVDRSHLLRHGPIHGAKGRSVAR